MCLWRFCLLRQVLDPENRGYIDEHTMHELLTENAWALRDKVSREDGQREHTAAHSSSLSAWLGGARCAARISASCRISLSSVLASRCSLLHRCSFSPCRCRCARWQEWEDFMRVAKDPDTNYIHYEVRRGRRAEGERAAGRGGGGGGDWSAAGRDGTAFLFFSFFARHRWSTRARAACGPRA